MGQLVCKECGCVCQTQLADEQKTVICAACEGINFKKIKISEGPRCDYCYGRNPGTHCVG